MARRKAPTAERLAYNVEEAAELIGVSDDLVYGWIKSGELTATLLNKRRFVMREDLLTFLRDHREEVAS
jgi:excisionase family DNA binding protein